GLLVRSMERVLATTPGFEPSRALTMQVVATGKRLSDAETLRLFQQTLEAVQNVPGVSRAASANQLPLSGAADLCGAAFASAPLTDERNGAGTLRYAVTPDWFQALGIPLLQGRLLDARDRAPAPVAVLINESFAKRRFGDRSAIGQRVRFGPQINAADRSWSTIVGVVGDVRHSSLALPPPDAFYVAIGHWPWVDDVQTLVVRAERDPLALVDDIKRAIWSVDPDLPVTRIAAMSDVLAASE